MTPEVINSLWFALGWTAGGVFGLLVWLVIQLAESKPFHMRMKKCTRDQDCHLRETFQYKGWGQWAKKNDHPLTGWCPICQMQI